MRVRKGGGVELAEKGEGEGPHGQVFPGACSLSARHVSPPLSLSPLLPKCLMPSSLLSQQHSIHEVLKQKSECK